MSANRFKWAAGIAVSAMIALALGIPAYMHRVEVQAIVDRSHSDTAAAKSAADSAADSAAKAKASAQDAQNRVPGSS